MGEKRVVSCPIANPQEMELGTRGIRAKVEDQSGFIDGSCHNRRLTTSSNLVPKWPFFVLDRTNSADMDVFAKKGSSKKDFRGEQRYA